MSTPHYYRNFVCSEVVGVATSQKSVNQYRQKNYYTFSVSVPAQYKETIKAAAAERGVSVSRLVCDLLGRELGLDLALDGVFPGAKKAEEP